MARIIITNRSGLIFQGKAVSPAYYEGMVQQLLAMGHDVLHFVSSDYLVPDFSTTNEPNCKSHKKNALERARKFNPDLVISFNNCSIAGMDKAVDCPIILWEADSFQYFNDKEHIKQKADRYHYVSISSGGYKEYLELLSVAKNRVLRTLPATVIQNRSEPKTYNVSFIGNPFFANSYALSFLEKHPAYKDRSIEEIDAIKNFDKYMVPRYGVSKLNLKNAHPKYNRVDIISSLLECDIKLFGSKDWTHFPGLLEEYPDTYDPRIVYSVKQNELIYNRSILSLNINHAQAAAGYSWRVADILASSAALFSNRSIDLEADFKDVGIPFYDNPGEARELAKKLLASPSWREDLIAKSNEVVENRHRWHHCIPAVGDFVGVNLTEQGTLGHYERFDPMLSRIERGYIALVGIYYNRGTESPAPPNMCYRRVYLLCWIRNFYNKCRSYKKILRRRLSYYNKVAKRHLMSSNDEQYD